MGAHDDEDTDAGPTEVGTRIDFGPELAAALDDLETLLKNGDVVATLTAKGVNASIALVAAHALRAYLAGRKADAAEDFATVGEEIRGRLEAAGDTPPRGDGPARSSGRH